jgi:hypothetical protein
MYGREFIPIDPFVPEHCHHDGTVCGWMSPEDVLYAMNKVQSFVRK